MGDFDLGSLWLSLPATAPVTAARADAEAGRWPGGPYPPTPAPPWESAAEAIRGITSHARYRAGRIRRGSSLTSCAMLPPNRSSSTAARKGTLVDKAIELFHAGVPDAYAAACKELGWRGYKESKEFFEAYVADDRHSTVVAKFQQLPVRLTIVVDGQDFEIGGAPDQVRRYESGNLEVWDVKAGKPDGPTMRQSYAPQLAAYALALTETLGTHVAVGGIVRLRDYVEDGPVLWEVPMDHEACRRLVRQKIRDRIHGHVTPGPWCFRCPWGKYPGCISKVPGGLKDVT